ncbi:MAG: glutamate--tRNA ligase [Chloroflexota bacterium]
MGPAVRVRFAPSPTGYPHVGNIRTALFNWLFARHGRGVFILRIEDTDVARKVEGAVEAIMAGLKWLGLDWDEGPFLQSQRLDIYEKHARWLVDNNHAYYCWCSPQRLEAMREEQVRRKQPPGYDRHCRDLSDKEKAERAASGVRPVVRFKTPLEGQMVFTDLIRGEVAFDNSTLDDFVMLKSDGYPTYHLANVVDDHLMRISHVMRADEWLSSTPRHKLMYQAFGWELPQFAHLPMILGPDRSKLSKRHGATSITEYQEQGYIPEAMFNFLALLGWSLDDKTELMSREQIIESFTIERISKTAAIFNREKLDWMNGAYLRQMSSGEYAARVLPFMEKHLPASAARPLDAAYLAKVIPLVQERARTLAEVPSLTDFFFGGDLVYETALLTSRTMDAAKAVEALKSAAAVLGPPENWNETKLEELLRAEAVRLNFSNRDYFGVLRVAVTGRTASPPLVPVMVVLGREQCLERVKSALRKLGVTA